MKRNYFFGIILFILFMFVFYNIRLPFPEVDMAIEEGYLDMSDMVLSDSGILKLDGQWQFYRGEFLLAKDIKKRDPVLEEAFLPVPKNWTGHAYQGDKMESYGYGTYALRIKVDPENNPMIAFKIKDIYSAHRMFWNDELIRELGTLTKSKEGVDSNYYPQTVFLPVSDEENLIVIQVSNYYQKDGGIYGRIYMGSPHNIHFWTMRNIGLELFVFGALLMISMYHFILVLLRREDRTSLVFGLFTMVLAIREITVGERLFNHIFRNVPLEVRASIEFAAFYLAVGFFAWFIYLIYSDIFKKKLLYVIMTVSFIFTAIVLVTPASIFSYTLTAYHVVTVLVCVYLLYIVFRGFSWQREGADVLLAGTLFLMIVTLNDILYSQRIIDTGFQLSTALITFAFCQATVLAIRNAKAYMAAENLLVRNEEINRELTRLNESLERKVEKRTEELVSKNHMLDEMVKKDSLTGLYNHKTIYEKLYEASLKEKNRKTGLCIAMIDIDYFKEVNDRFGHQIGDQVLVRVCRLIEENMRDNDILGRYGGEEFMIVLSETSLSQAFIVLERIRKAVAAYRFGEESLGVTISVGCVQFRQGESMDSLIGLADRRLYAAKNGGRNQVMIR